MYLPHGNLCFYMKKLSIIIGSELKVVKNVYIKQLNYFNQTQKNIFVKNINNYWHKKQK